MIEIKQLRELNNISFESMKNLVIELLDQNRYLYDYIIYLLGGYTEEEFKQVSHKYAENEIIDTEFMDEKQHKKNIKKLKELGKIKPVEINECNPEDKET